MQAEIIFLRAFLENDIEKNHLPEVVLFEISMGG
jgi:hypothetical protein